MKSVALMVMASALMLALPARAQDPQKPPSPGSAPLFVPPEMVDSRGAMLARACDTCHGPHGRSPAGMPALAGRKAQWLARDLRAYRDGRRSGTVMPAIARGYTPQDIEVLARWYAGQEE